MKPGAGDNRGLFLAPTLPRRCYRNGAAALFLVEIFRRIERVRSCETSVWLICLRMQRDSNLLTQDLKPGERVQRVADISWREDM
jgi:hypothetical protein